MYPDGGKYNFQLAKVVCDNAHFRSFTADEKFFIQGVLWFSVKAGY